MKKQETVPLGRKLMAAILNDADEIKAPWYRRLFRGRSGPSGYKRGFYDPHQGDREKTRRPSADRKGDTPAMKRKTSPAFKGFNWNLVTFSLWDRIKLTLKPIQVFIDRSEGIEMQFKATKAGKMYIYQVKHTIGRVR